MDTREKIKLHRVFRVLWFVWLLAFLAAICPVLPVFGDINFARWLYAAFLVVELVGHFRPNKRSRIGPEGEIVEDSGGDTLSEWMQNVSSWSPDSVPWYKSFKVIPIGFALTISALAAWTMSYWAEPWDRWMVGVPFGLTVLLWNLYHWTKRRKYG